MGKKFDRLKAHVAREYEAKGYGAERAEKIGVAVAARVERMKQSREEPKPDAS